jgi:hypothetical protein
MASFYKYNKLILYRIYYIYNTFISLLVPDINFIFDPIGHYSRSKSPLKQSLMTLLTH